MNWFDELLDKLILLKLKLFKKKFKTYDQILKDLIKSISVEDTERLIANYEKDLIRFHHTTGRAIRNHYDLWDSNNPITRNYQNDADESRHPDTISMNLITDLWKHLKGNQDGNIDPR